MCSESGSHDYAIHRREAKGGLGLPIETPSVEFYDVIKRIYQDVVSEMVLDNPFKPDVVLGADRHKDYECRRILIESVSNGTDVFITKGFMEKTPAAHPNTGDVISNILTEEMWHHEN